MAGERTFTEGEAYALVADAVERETAAAKAEADTIREERDKLATENDVLTQRVTAAEEKAADAEKALEDYKAEVETEKAMEAKRGERLAKVAEIAPDLVDGDDEKVVKRCDRIVAMADEDFQEYIDSLSAVAPEKANDDGKGGKTVVDKTVTATDKDGKPLPRESAAFKGSRPENKKGSVADLHAARRKAMTASKSA